MARGDISVGDKVVAIKDGGHDLQGRPVQRPLRGQVHIVTSIYEMRYGLGCTLQGLDPSPYRGYFLFVNRKGQTVKKGWYFEKVEAADEEFTATLYEYLRSKEDA